MFMQVKLSRQAPATTGDPDFGRQACVRGNRVVNCRAVPHACG